MVLSFLCSSTLFAKTIDIHPKWKERALEAQAKLKELEPKAAQSLEYKYWYNLEKAFAVYSDPTQCSNLISEKDGTQTYKLMINCGTGKSDCLLVEYTYNKRTNQLITHSVSNLPEGWVLISYVNKSRLLAVLDKDGNGYAIDLNDPTTSYVTMASK